MRHLIRSEWLKLTTTRGQWITVAGLLALIALITPVAMSEIGQGDRSANDDALEALAIGPGFITALVLLILGALGSAGEFRHRTVVATYLITPRRGRVLVAKLLAHATVGAAVASLGVLIAFPIVLLMAGNDGVHVASGAHLVGLAGAIVAAGGLASMLGIAAGSIIRNQTAAIVIVLVWTLMVEQLFGGFFPPILPFGAILGVVGMVSEGGPGVLGSFIVLTAWVGVLVAAAVTLIKRDVT